MCRGQRHPTTGRCPQSFGQGIELGGVRQGYRRSLALAGLRESVDHPKRTNEHYLRRRRQRKQTPSRPSDTVSPVGIFVRRDTPGFGQRCGGSTSGSLIFCGGPNNLDATGGFLDRFDTGLQKYQDTV